MERYFVGSTVYVQKVRTAPMPNLLLGCANSKVKQFQRDVKEFIPLIEEKRRFAGNLKKNLEKARVMMHEEPCLVMDFQVLVDARGMLYHLDLDRCFEPNDSNARRAVSKEMTDACFDALVDIETTLLQSLEA